MPLSWDFSGRYFGFWNTSPKVVTGLYAVLTLAPAKILLIVSEMPLTYGIHV